ncbi:hypothetical protein G6M78_14290 [Agrobacterium tumefaciens]|uniref:hypothetical protein n=1 Tax=Agrobacterium tumefaciens TaxID=358 RepID=UPI001573D958|nr:hypothetical protein [Agrobacterium tumefaciens]NTE56242.1 hypothetical protein [Agrobacterium tumefaciens]NTE74047.1 hypothetical protein [Agrobacterium tumefaciens]
MRKAHLRKWIFSGLLVFSTVFFSADISAAAENECGTHGEDIIHQAYPAAQKTTELEFSIGNATLRLPADTFIGSDPHVIVCRLWPANPDLMLVAVPLMTKLSDYENEGDLDILVVENKSLQLRQRLRVKGIMNDDAIIIRGMTFDTARYQLAPGKTAFGIRIETEGSSRANPFGDTTLRLYTIDGEHLRSVLDNIVVRENVGEWDTTCAGNFQTTTRTLTMARRTHGGAADIVVTETEAPSIFKVMPDGQCESFDEKKQIRKIQVTYDGKVYVVPRGLKREY